MSWPCLVMSFFPAPQFHWSRSPKVVRASLGGWSGGSTGCSLWFSRCVLSWVDLVCTHLLCPAVCVSLLPVCRISVVCVSSLTVFWGSLEWLLRTALGLPCNSLFLPRLLIVQCRHLPTVGKGLSSKCSEYFSIGLNINIYGHIYQYFY